MNANQREAHGLLIVLGFWYRAHAVTCPQHGEGHAWATCYCKVQADARAAADAMLMERTKDIPF